MNLEDIKLDPVYGSSMCQYSVIENKLETLYENQEKLLLAIKLLAEKITNDAIFSATLDFVRGELQKDGNQYKKFMPPQLVTDTKNAGVKLD